MKLPTNAGSLRWLKIVAAVLLALWALSFALPSSAQDEPPVDSAIQIQELRDLIELDPSDPEPHTKLGILLTKEGLYEEARMEFIAALQAAPAEPTAHLNLGLLFLKMENWSEAQSVLGNYTNMRPDDPKGYLDYGRAFEGAGDLDRARSIWMDASQTGGMSDKDRAMLVERAAQTHLDEEDLESANELLQRDPDLLQAQGVGSLRSVASYTSVQLAKRAKEDDEIDEALEHYADARRVEPNDKGAYAEPLELLLAADRMDEATDLVDEATVALPGESTPEFMAGRLAEESGDPQSAAEKYKAVERMDPEYPGLYAKLGSVLAELGDDAGAASALEQAVKRGQGGAAAAYNMGVVLSQKGQFREAIPHLETAVEADPTHKDALRALGQAYRKTDRYGDMARVYQQIYDSFGPDARDIYQLAYAQAKLDRHAEAADNYEMVVLMDGQNFAARYNLGNSLVKLERFGEAVEQFETALQLRPDNELARYNLALCHQMSGNFERAIENYELALELKVTYRSYVNMAICYSKLEDTETSDYYYGLANDLKKQGRR